MTTIEFNRLWESGKEVEVDFGVRVDSNYQSFPERVTAEHTEGVFCGIHFAFNDIPVFSIEHQVCMFDLEIVDQVPISRRKDSHGCHVYAIKMIGDEVFPVLEIEYGLEWRALGTRCIIRKVEL